jgi:hypothetical protein
MHATNRIRKIFTAVSIVFIAAMLLGAVARHPAKEMTPISPLVARTVSAPTIAEPTGEYQNAVPVYRLPSIAVTVSRSEALARIAREESLEAK